jgi:hypothetical protein
MGFLFYNPNSKSTTRIGKTILSRLFTRGKPIPVGCFIASMQGLLDKTGLFHFDKETASDSRVSGG